MTRFAHTLLLCSLLLGCRAPCPVPKTVQTHSLIPRSECSLPALPSDLSPAVGFPTPETILVSRTDFALMIAHVNQLNRWIEAAAACLESR